MIFFLIFVLLNIFFYGSYKRYLLSQKISKSLNFFKLIYNILGVIFLYISTLDIKKSKNLDTKRYIPICFCLDISKSMLVEDILPNRLEVAKKIILDSINKIDRDLGIIVFAAEAYTFLPITSDRELATTFLESIDSNYIAPGATNISKALLLANEDGRDKVVVVLTDGEDSYMDAKQYVNNRTFFVAVGTKNGGPIPFQGGYLKNENNSNVISKINYTYLNSLGRTYSLVGVGRDLKDLTSDISKILDYFDSKSMDYERYYQIFLAISIIFFLFGYFAKSFKD